MQKNQYILLGVLTIIMIAATVFYVRAENTQPRLRTDRSDETGIQSVIRISDIGSSQTGPTLQTPMQANETAAGTPGLASSPLQLGSPAQTEPAPGTTIAFQQGTGVTRTPQATTFTQNTPTGSPTNPVIVNTTQPAPVFTPTPLPQSGWAGDWTVWFGKDTESLTTGAMQVSVSGTALSAVATFDGLEITMQGKINPSNQQVIGQYTSPTGDGWFLWERISSKQFGGTLNNLQVFCAARSGEALPEPCGIFSTL